MALLRGVCCRSHITFRISFVRGFAATAPGRSAENKKNTTEIEQSKEIQVKYRNEVRQIVKGFLSDRLEYERQRKAAEGELQKVLQLEREMQERVIEDVKQGNEQLAAKRARRLYIKQRRQNDLNQKKQEAANRGDEELRKRKIAMVQQAIEESKDFVTPENLEEKIAHALENETNYNFALTSSGQKLISKSPPGSVNTELHAPGPAAFMNSPPSVQKEWTTGLSDDESQRPKDEGKKDNSWQKWRKRAKSA